MDSRCDFMTCIILINYSKCHEDLVTEVLYIFNIPIIYGEQVPRLSHTKFVALERTQVIQMYTGWTSGNRRQRRLKRPPKALFSICFHNITKNYLTNSNLRKKEVVVMNNINDILHTIMKLRGYNDSAFGIILIFTSKVLSNPKTFRMYNE